MEQGIYSITEAFSMQPSAFYIGSKLEGGKINKLEFAGDENQFIIASDNKGKLLAEFHRKSVNIFYK
jgi:hypothetical protein